MLLDYLGFASRDSGELRWEANVEFSRFPDQVQCDTERIFAHPTEILRLSYLRDRNHHHLRDPRKRCVHSVNDNAAVFVLMGCVM